MEGLILVVLLGVVSCSHISMSTSVLEVTVRPGDSITLYCDCKQSLGVYIVWYRNCSHEKQPPLVFNVRISDGGIQFPRFKFEKNFSSDSYDLVILNTTTSDEGLYYCGTEELTLVGEKNKTKFFTSKTVYTYGNIITRITVGSNVDMRQDLQDCEVYRKLLFSVCPAVSLLFTLILSFLVYLLFHKTDDEKRHDTMRQTGETQGGFMFYAALEILQASQRPERKKTLHWSDFSSYSTVRYVSSGGGGRLSDEKGERC